MHGKSEYRTRLSVEPGGVSRRIRGQLARQKIDRELHGVVIASGEVKGRVPEHMADWFYDLRRKQLRIYGGLLRFIDVSAATGVPESVIRIIPEVIHSYIDDAYESANKAA